LTHTVNVIKTTECTDVVPTSNIVVGGGGEGVGEDKWVKGQDLTQFCRVRVVAEGLGEGARVGAIEDVSDRRDATLGVDTETITRTYHNTLLRQQTHDVRLSRTT